MTEMQTMQEYIDDCYYNTERGSLYELGVALPGYRIEEVTADGHIGSYGDDRLTPVAHCDPRYRVKARSLLEMVQMMQYRAASPALTHDPGCNHCGHRIVRSLKELAEFAAVVGESKEWENSFMNYDHPIFRTGYFAVVECMVPAGGFIADRSRENSEIPGTIRTDRLALGKTVILPRYFGKRDQRPVAKLIRRRYGVKVKQPDTDDMTLINGFMSG